VNRLILRFLNFPILLLLTAIAIAIQTSLFAEWPLRFFQPNIVLLVVVWCALKRTFLEGGIFTLLIGDFAELHSAVPQGVFLLCYMALYLVLRAADKLLVLPTKPPMIKLSMACFAFWHISAMILMSSMAHRPLWKSMIVHLVPGAVMAAVLGAWVFRALENFDLLTFKNVSAENPDEFQIENLGL
jgi:hypothetical protein